MRFPHALFTSTLTGEGIDELIKRIGLATEAHQVLMEVLIPFTKGELVVLRISCSMYGRIHRRHSYELARFSRALRSSVAIA